MGATIIWVILGILAYLWRGKIIDTVVALVFIFIMFFGVAYLSDNYSNLNLRWFFPKFMYFYEEAVDDPVGTAKKVGEDAKDLAKDAADKLDVEVEKAGKHLDGVIEGTKETDKSDVYKEKSQEDVNLQAEQGENTIIWGEEPKENKATKKEVQVTEEGSRPTFVTYDEMKEVLKTDLAWLPEEDKDLLRNANPYMTTKVKGKEIKMVAGKHGGSSGVVIEYIGVD